MTDEVEVRAVVRNSTGHELTVSRGDDGRAYANFALSDRSLDVLDQARLPVLRIDKHKAVELKVGFPELGLVLARAEPKWVNFVAWHGQGKPDKGILHQLLMGQVLRVRYFLFTGGYKETQFSLRGADAAIRTAIGLVAPAQHPADRASDR